MTFSSLTIRDLNINLVLASTILKLFVMFSTNSFEEFGIHNDAERYSWAAVHFLVFATSLIGDSLILFASFQKDAFKLNKFIVAIIRFIAVFDIAFAISSVLPVSISLLANSWILGEAMCYARVYLSSVIYVSGMLLIAFLTTSKMLLLKYPIRCSNLTAKVAVKSCSCLVMLTLSFPLLFLIAKDDVLFSYKTYTCEYGFQEPSMRNYVGPILSFIFVLIPNVVIVATTIPTLQYLLTAHKSARRMNGKIPWQGALTVTCTALVYFLSTFPLIVYHICESLVAETQTGGFYLEFSRLTEFLVIINITSNFFIYTITVKSFRKFLRLKICQVLRAPRCRSRNEATHYTDTGKNYV